MAIKAVDSKTLSIAPIGADSAEFKRMDKAQSVNMSLPDEFTVPTPPNFAKMVFNNLKDENNNPRTGLGTEIITPDGQSKVVTISSLSRKFFNEEVKPGETSGKAQIAVIDAFQDVNTMQLSPSQQVELIAGKTVKKDGTAMVYVAEFKDGEVQGYKETEKAIFKVQAS